MNRAQLGLWGAIAGVFLLAILGIRSAANWLAQGTPDTPADQTLTITANPDTNPDNGTNSNLTDSNPAERDSSPIAGTRVEDRIIADRNSDRISAQTDGQANTPANPQSTQQTDTLTFSPLEEAGTYIQRQKSVEQDTLIAATTVEAVPLASSTPVAAQSDSRVTQPTPTTVTNNQPSEARPAAPASPAVPALW